MKRFLFVLLAAAPLLAQDPPKAAPPQCTDHGKMMQEMKARDARLDQLLQSMNKAAAPKKVDLMADILRELLAERRNMHAHMACMMEAKKGDMMKGEKTNPPAKAEPSNPVQPAKKDEHKAHH